MKRMIFTILTSCLLVTIMSIPVLAKSNRFSFTMGNRVVDGSKNGIYYSLDGGTKPRITGSMRQINDTTIAPRNTIYAELRNKTSGNSFGAVTLGSPSQDGRATYFDKRFSRATGGGSKYYLIIYRAESDGRTMNGSGTLSD